MSLFKPGKGREIQDIISEINAIKGSINKQTTANNLNNNTGNVGDTAITKLGKGLYNFNFKTEDGWASILGKIITNTQQIANSDLVLQDYFVVTFDFDTTTAASTVIDTGYKLRKTLHLITIEITDAFENDECICGVSDSVAGDVLFDGDYTSEYNKIDMNVKGLYYSYVEKPYDYVENNILFTLDANSSGYGTGKVSLYYSK